MGMFSGIGEAKVYSSGNYIRAGQHLFKVEELKAFESRKKDDMYVAELEVVESEGGINLESEDVPAHKPGEKVSWMANLTQHDAAIGNVKGFLAALADAEIEEITEEVAEASVNPKQPFKGWYIMCQAKVILTKAGKPFTVMNWYHVGETLPTAAE